MQSLEPSLLTAFLELDIREDTDRISEIFNHFALPTRQCQAQLLELVKQQLGVTYGDMANICQMSLANFNKVKAGQIDLQPPSLRILLMQLLILSQNQELFCRINGLR